MTTDTFIVMKNELETDLDVGETGMIMIPVEVITIDKDTYTFRKAGQIKPEGEFKPESVKGMRERIGVVEDIEEPMSESEDEDED